MRRFLAFIFVSALCLSLIACGESNAPDSGTQRPMWRKSHEDMVSELNKAFTQEDLPFFARFDDLDGNMACYTIVNSITYGSTSVWLDFTTDSSGSGVEEITIRTVSTATPEAITSTVYILGTVVNHNLATEDVCSIFDHMVDDCPELSTEEGTTHRTTSAYGIRFILISDYNQGRICMLPDETVD